MKKLEELLQLSRNHLHFVGYLLTGHCTLKGYLQDIEINAGNTNCRLITKDYFDQAARDLYRLVRDSRILEWLMI